MSISTPGFPNRSLNGIIFALLLAEFTSAFELTMIITALKQIIIEFESPAGSFWMVTSYLLVAAASAAVCGRLGDLFGRRRVLLAMLLMAAFGSFVSLVGNSLWVVVAGRALQGFAGAILPLCYGLVRENFPKERVSFGVAIIAYSVLIAGAAGGLVGGLLVDFVGWRSIFIASGTLAVLSFVTCIALVPRSSSQPPSGNLDILGGVIFVPALAALLLGMSNIGTAGLWAMQSGVLLVVGIGLMIVWVWHELRTPDPLINLRLIGRRNTALATIAMSCYAFGPSQGQAILLLAQQSPATGIGLGLSATNASLLFIPSQFLALFVPPIAAIACSRMGARPVLIFAGMMLTASSITLLLFHTSIWGIIGMSFLGVLSTVCLYAAAPNLIVSEVPVDQTSGATGMMQVSRSMAAAAGSQIVAALLAVSVVMDPVTGSGPFPSRSSYLIAMAFMGLSSLGLLVSALLVPRKQPDV